MSLPALKFSAAHDPRSEPDRDAQRASYFESLHLIERLHHLLFDLVKDEFTRLGFDELTPVQAMLLYNLGTSEVSAGELRSRGMYHGSNVSYNLKKLVKMGYLSHERSTVDRRSVRVRLTERGEAVRDVIGALFSRHAEGLRLSGVLDDPDICAVTRQWRRVERYWADQIRYIY